MSLDNVPSLLTLFVSLSLSALTDFTTLFNERTGLDGSRLLILCSKMSMKCVVCYAPGDYRMEERPVPTPKAGEILVKVTAVGICAGDAKCHAGAPLFWGDETRDAYW